MNVTRVFTDGACSGNPGAGGWAVMFNFSTKQTYLCGGEKLSTNNRMELKAFLEGIKEILRLNEKSTKFDLYSDSAYIVNVMNSSLLEKWKKRGWKTQRGLEVKNSDLWIEVENVMGEINLRSLNLEILKIKAHCGNTFNNRVDFLAKEQAKKHKEDSK